MLGTLQVGDDIVSNDLRQRLRSQCEMNLHRTLCDKMCDQVSILCCYCARGNAGSDAITGVREPVVGSSHRSNQRSGCTQVGCGLLSGNAIGYRLAVGFSRVTGSGFLMIEGEVENNNLTCNLCPA